jgi:hypothetical protein
MLAFGKKTRVSGRLFALLLRSEMNCRVGRLVGGNRMRCQSSLSE